MLVVDDIAFIDEIGDGLNDKLEKWKHTLKSRRFKLSKSKTEYFWCGFSGVEEGSGEVTMGGVIIPRIEKFKYLWSIIEERWDINNDIHCIRVGQQK